LIQSLSGLAVTAVCADLQTIFPVRRRPTGIVETFSGKGAVPAATEPVEVDTEDYGCVLLRFAGGARGCVYVSQVTAGRKNCLRFEMAGSEQSVRGTAKLRTNCGWVSARRPISCWCAIRHC
jgi:predicted dehydrogenase